MELVFSFLLYWGLGIKLRSSDLLNTPLPTEPFPLALLQDFCSLTTISPTFFYLYLRSLMMTLSLLPVPVSSILLGTIYKSGHHSSRAEEGFLFPLERVNHL